MSIFPTESVKEYASTIGIKDLGTEEARTLANDVEYRLRETIQDATKFMEHSGRSKLALEDINNALKMKNIDTIYGYDPTDKSNFIGMLVKIKETDKRVYYVPEKNITLLEYISVRPEAPPLMEAISSHWMAIEGVAPKISDNLLEENIGDISAPFDRDEVREGAVKKPLFQHTLSKELQMYFDLVEEAILSKDNKRIIIIGEAVENDAGIQQLVPYFTQMISDIVIKNLRSLFVLNCAMVVSRSIVNNRNLCIEPYLQQLLPSIMTCVLGKSLCDDLQKEDHWRLRRYSAETVAIICKKYSSVYLSFESRINKTYNSALADSSKPLTTHYGAIYGLKVLGFAPIDCFIIPKLKGYLECLKEIGESSIKQMVYLLIKEIYSDWRKEKSQDITDREGFTKTTSTLDSMLK
eukprot:GHVP01047479.1.p2 GENE.GHVP01047479.1~~GHVP01047479.1.p2  ORF type:complete len:409 (-),score=75.55 GHVP01047479.1:91-1317(-)